MLLSLHIIVVVVVGSGDWAVVMGGAGGNNQTCLNLNFYACIDLSVILVQKFKSIKY